ncbi:potassium channel family protein [Humisphaera borealis]|uniref:Two pore domain potassium channel family protein n=1 Tax=Humisphaera borealis TaxID=2807512 RepID=A0A7M2WVY0_9BACT|nr:potassium channel family protein [Humisphaera borealis]QOV88650.1 two pore domain potassium channel family protein [Humisphaera borealis]
MGWKDDLNYGLAAFGIKIPETMPLDALAPKLASAPLRNSAALIAVSSAAFLAAERGHNPKVNDIYDAMIYCSTCLSVGYADIFPRTPIGKLIGTILMTAGPALAARALDGQAQDDTVGRADAIQQDILKTLQSILDRLPPAATSAAEVQTPQT